VKTVFFFVMNVREVFVPGQCIDAIQIMLMLSSQFHTERRTDM
jgi:hypothetical protein